MFELLLGASVIYLALGELSQALMLVGSAVITVTVSIVQETRTERVLETLRDLASPRAAVIRNGISRRIPGREVVCGDLIVLAEGDRVPADAVLLSSDVLESDESLLTGESVSVRKIPLDSSELQLLAARPGGNDLPFVFAGTMVVRGHGIGEVCAIGAATEIGRIGKAFSEISAEPSPLHRQTRRVVRTFAVFALAISGLVVALYVLMRGSWLDGILAGITVAMAMLPEEFPLVLTIFLAMGAWRISKARVLTRRSSTIETLGSATVLCTDKTGTLTLNRMSIAELVVGDEVFTTDDQKLREIPGQFLNLIELGILACQEHPIDPMELAFHELGRKYLAPAEQTHPDWILSREYGFSSQLLATSYAWKPPEREDHVVAAKGAPEAIADLCRLDSRQIAKMTIAVNRMAARGMRVLGIATARFHASIWPDSQRGFAFEFMGLVGLADPLHPAVPIAVSECRAAGIQVVMITGDYPATARSIAEQAGLDCSAGIISGPELATLSDTELHERARTVRVFARTMPEQKLRLVNAFKDNGEQSP